MFKPRLSYATVVSTLALFIALGGVGYAATQLPQNSVGAYQLKRNSVTTAKLKNGAVTGAKIKLSSLGRVPSAVHADRADTAATADSAKSATSAAVADRAESLVAPEGVHVIGTAGEPAFRAGWGNFSNQTPVSVFYKDREGIVHLEGDAANANGTGTVVFQLPAGYAPAGSIVFPILGAGALATLNVQPSGSVSFLAGNSTHVVLNGVTWRAAG
jgi:hypothetical protein